VSPGPSDAVDELLGLDGAATGGHGTGSLAGIAPTVDGSSSPIAVAAASPECDNAADDYIVLAEPCPTEGDSSSCSDDLFGPLPSHVQVAARDFGGTYYADNGVYLIPVSPLDSDGCLGVSAIPAHLDEMVRLLRTSDWFALLACLWHETHCLEEAAFLLGKTAQAAFADGEVWRPMGVNELGLQLVTLLLESAESGLADGPILAKCSQCQQLCLVTDKITLFCCAGGSDPQPAPSAAVNVRQLTAPTRAAKEKPLVAFDTKGHYKAFLDEKAGRGLPGIVHGGSAAARRVMEALNTLSDYIRVGLELFVESGRFETVQRAYRELVVTLGTRHGLGHASGDVDNHVLQRTVRELVLRFEASRKRRNSPFVEAYKALLGVLPRQNVAELLGRAVSEREYRDMRLAARDVEPGVQRTREPRAAPVTAEEMAADVLECLVPHFGFGAARSVFDVSGAKGTLLTQLICKAMQWDPNSFPRVQLLLPTSTLISAVQARYPNISASFVRSVLDSSTFVQPGQSSGHCTSCAAILFEPLKMLRAYVATLSGQEAGQARKLVEQLRTHVQSGEFYHACSPNSPCATHNIAYAYGLAGAEGVIDSSLVCTGCASLVMLGELDVIKSWIEWPRICSELRQSLAHILRTKHAHDSHKAVMGSVGPDTATLQLDDATNFQNQESREPQVNNFAKRGTKMPGGLLSWSDPVSHLPKIATFLGPNDRDTKKNGEGSLAWLIYIASFMSLLGIASGMDFVWLKLLCDNGTAFHNAAFVSGAAAAAFFASKGKIRVREILFSEPGEGKSMLDQRFSVILGYLRRWVRSGHTVLGAMGIVAAIRGLCGILRTVISLWTFSRVSGHSSLPEFMPATMSSYRRVVFVWEGSRVVRMEFFHCGPCGDFPVPKEVVTVSAADWDHWIAAAEAADVQGWKSETVCSSEDADLRAAINQMAAPAGTAEELLEVSSIHSASESDGDGPQLMELEEELPRLACLPVPIKEPETPPPFSVRFGHLSSCPVCKQDWRAPFTNDARWAHLEQCAKVNRRRLEGSLFQCPVHGCSAEFQSPGALPSHVVREHCAGEWVCRACNNAHSTRGLAQACCHEDAGCAHLLEKYPCGRCGARYQKRGQLARHECKSSARDTRAEAVLARIRAMLDAHYVAETVTPSQLAPIDGLDGFLGRNAGYANPDAKPPRFRLSLLARYLRRIAYDLGAKGIVAQRQVEDMIALHAYVDPGACKMRASEIYSSWGSSGAKVKKGTAVALSNEEQDGMKQVVADMRNGVPFRGLPQVIRDSVERLELSDLHLPELKRRVAAAGLSTDTGGAKRNAKKAILVECLLKHLRGQPQDVAAGEEGAVEEALPGDQGGGRLFSLCEGLGITVACASVVGVSSCISSVVITCASVGGVSSCISSVVITCASVGGVSSCISSVVITCASVGGVSSCISSVVITCASVGGVSSCISSVVITCASVGGVLLPLVSSTLHTTIQGFPRPSWN
jgi:hypothetical protein